MLNYLNDYFNNDMSTDHQNESFWRNSRCFSNFKARSLASSVCLIAQSAFQPSQMRQAAAKVRALPVPNSQCTITFLPFFNCSSTISLTPFFIVFAYSQVLISLTGQWKVLNPNFSACSSSFSISMSLCSSFCKSETIVLMWYLFLRTSKSS